MVEASNEFPDGSITKIALENFMTYAKFCMYPGPNLNIIIGANGTGKSSIICAICIALGGSPKILGRSEKYNDYIKHDSETASIELHLRHSRDDAGLMIKAVLKKDKVINYQLNGTHCTIKELKRVVKECNIQIENPCNFLAQDRVRSFAEQSPKVLLENTETALTGDLVKLHEAFRSAKSAGIGVKERLENFKKRKTEVENEMAKLSRAVENCKRKEAMDGRIRTLEKKFTFMKFQSEQLIYAGYLNILESLTTEKIKAENVKQGLQKMQEKWLSDENQLSQKLSTLKSEYKLLKNDIQEAVQKNQLATLIHMCKQDLEKVQKEHMEREKNMDAIRAEIEHLNRKLAETNFSNNDYNAAKREYDECVTRNDELMIRKQRIDKIFEEIETEKRSSASFELFCLLHELEIYKKQGLNAKMRILGAKDSLYVQAWNWYEANKARFSGPLYVPILSIELIDARAARYLENVIARNDLFTFIFSCQDDEKLLTDRRHPWKLHSSVILDEEIAKYNEETAFPRYLKDFGLDCMASNLFTGPASVMAYLKNTANLRRIPIGFNMSGTDIENKSESLRQTPYRLFLTNSYRVRFFVSKYTGGISTSFDPLREKINFLTAHSDSSTEIEKESKEKYDRLRSRYDEAVTKRNQYETDQKLGDECLKNCGRQLNELQKKYKAYEAIHSQITTKQQRLNTVVRSELDLDAAQRAFEERKASAINDCFELIGKLADMLERSSVHIIQSESLTSSLNSVKNEHSKLIHKIREASENLKEKEVKFEEQKQLNEQFMREIFEKTRCELKEKTGLTSTILTELSSNKQHIYNQLMEEFSCFPSFGSFTEVETELIREKEHISALHSEDDIESFNRYNELNIELNKIEQVLFTATIEVCNITNDLEKALDDWLKPLLTFIDEINGHFKSFFKRLDCEGEVKLERPEEKFDVDSYGIIISTKFRRNECLRRVTHQVQSGGERSVATMLYLMALQQMSAVPFRCVDEINQGMDPQNERLVFNMLVELLSSDDSGRLSSSQYFMLTPKLLYGLTYRNKISVHCIWSGEFTVPSEDFSMERFLHQAGRSTRLISA